MKTPILSFVAFMLILAVPSRSSALDTTIAPRGRVFYNLDCTEFFMGTFGPVVPETIDKFVDAHAAVGVTDWVVNVNSQRTNYPSDAWDSYWKGYDPAAGNDQPFFAGIVPKDKSETEMITNMFTLSQQGCDYPKRMIDRAKRDRTRAWISLRMNDSHYPDQPNHPYHSTFWRDHPQWLLCNGPNPVHAGGWSDRGLDYEQFEVREHYLKLVKEVCARYDLDGLELDFLRFDLYFRPGREHEGAKVMTAFLEQVRTVTREAAKRWGHPVELAVRVASTPWIARRHGHDAIAWAKAGLVDLIAVSPFWPSVDSDMPIETWKGLLIGTKVSVALGLEGCIVGRSGIRSVTPEEMRGVVASGVAPRGGCRLFFQLVHRSIPHMAPRGL